MIRGSRFASSKRELVRSYCGPRLERLVSYCSSNVFVFRRSPVGSCHRGGVSPNRASMVCRTALGSALLASLLACQRSSPAGREHDRHASPPSTAPSTNDGAPLRLDAALAACREHARLPCDVREEACQRALFDL